MENLDVKTQLKNINETVSWLKTKTKSVPEIAVVLGSGLGAFAKDIEVEISIPYKDIPHFHSTTVFGHAGNLIFGKVSGRNIVVQQGRFHFYEGHPMTTVIFPVRVLAALGAKTFVLTNAAGGIKDGMSNGDLMVIEDHINLIGTHPLHGPNVGELGPRFPDMTEAYDFTLREKLIAIMKKNKVSFTTGIYGGLSGPTYETPAEVRYLKMIGCDAVGMSTVPETIAARHLGAKVAGISCITNLAAGIAKHTLNHDEVTETTKLVEQQFCAVLKEFVGLI
jgi:purine-nucleoside phosphorylase